jgi:Na+-transporting NADH:ubiquinone oxidoreductase subunit NqrF
MRVAGIEVRFATDGPGGRVEKTLPEYLSSLACVIRLPAGTLAELSKSDLIALWSQQQGASHEDWSVDERLATIFSSGVTVGSSPIEGQASCGICRTVLHVAGEFLAKERAARSAVKD